MTIIVKFTNDKLGYLYKEKPHFIQTRLNEMKPNYGKIWNMAFDHLCYRWSKDMGLFVERIYEDDQMVIFVIELSLYFNFQAMGLFCL